MGGESPREQQVKQTALAQNSKDLTFHYTVLCHLIRTRRHPHPCDRQTPGGKKEEKKKISLALFFFKRMRLNEI